MPDRYPLPEDGFALAFDGAFHGHVVEQFDCVLLRYNHLTIELTLHRDGVVADLRNSTRKINPSAQRQNGKETWTPLQRVARAGAIVRRAMAQKINYANLGRLIRFALNRPIPSPL